VFEMTDDGSRAVRPDACWQCGHCVAVCPTDAIDHPSFPLAECPILDPERLPSLDALLAAFRARRSVRVFHPQPIGREIVREIVSAARWGPSAENNQALDWIALDDRDRIANLSRATVERLGRLVRLAAHPLTSPIAACVVGREGVRAARRSLPDVRRLSARAADGEDPVFFGAPVVLFGHTPLGNPFGRDDAVYAAHALMLAAEHRGLGTCHIGIFQLTAERSSELRRAIALPEGRRLQVAIAVGQARLSYRRLLPRRIPNLIWNPR